MSLEDGEEWQGLSFANCISFTLYLGEFGTTGKMA